MRIAIDWQKRGRDLFVLTAIGAFLAFINPYNATGSLSYPFAFLYWFAMVFCGGLGAEVAMNGYQSQFPRAPVWGMLAVGAIVSALCVTGFIIIVEQVFNNGVPRSFWFQLYGLVFVISLAITLIGYVIDRAYTNNHAPPTAISSDLITAFLQRLPVKYRTSQLYAISSEDHYLRVHTSIGEELILMRLADAVRELAGAHGLQVHRSWWVANDGVADEKRENGRSLLVLRSGAKVPVSRSYRAKAKDIGLIQ